LHAEGWDVHTQLEDPTGPPLEDYPDGDEKEAELSRRLQELDESLPKRALILKTSHIGGHKYAGNVIVRVPLTMTLSKKKIALSADGCGLDLRTSRCWRMVRSCVDARGLVHCAYDYSRRTDIASFIARGRQPLKARLQAAQ